MKTEILKLIDEYWKFDEYQQPRSSWHDKQDLLEAVRKILEEENGVCQFCNVPKNQHQRDLAGHTICYSTLDASVFADDSKTVLPPPTPGE